MCPSCGFPLGPEDYLCPQCGTTFELTRRSPAGEITTRLASVPSARASTRVDPVPTPPRSPWTGGLVIMICAVSALLLTFNAVLGFPRLINAPTQVIRVSPPSADSAGFLPKGLVPQMAAAPTQAWSASFGELFGATDFNTTRVLVPGTFDSRWADTIVLYAAKPAAASGPAGTIVAIDARTGTQVWRRPAGTDRLACAPRAVRGSLACLTGDGLTFYDLSTGAAARQVGVDRDAQAISVTADAIYVLSWRPPPAADLGRPTVAHATLRRLNTTGAQAWQVARDVPLQAGRDVRQLTIQAEEVPIGVTWPGAVELNAAPWVVRPDTGAMVPNLGLGEGRPRPGGVIPVTSTSSQGLQTRVLDPDGRLLAQASGGFDHISTYDHTPAQLPVLFVGTLPRELIAYARSGTLLWHNPDFDDANSYCLGALIARNPRTGLFGAVDPATGRTLWSARYTADPSLQTNVRCDGKHAILHDATGGSSLAGYDIATGTLAWRTPVAPSQVNAVMGSPAGLILHQQDRVSLLR